MPFITEEIWLTLPHNGESIVISSYPTYDDRLNYEAEEAKLEKVISAIKQSETEELK